MAQSVEEKLAGGGLQLAAGSNVVDLSIGRIVNWGKQGIL
jgi:hypothetical protein